MDSAATLHAWSATALERGRAVWPGLAIGEAELVRVAESRLARDAGCQLDALDGAELCIAVACARGDADALLRFRTRYFAPLASNLRNLGLGEAQHDDVWQILCERLLVAADGAAPRIVDYAGAGELSGLVRVAATRIALNWREQDRRRASSDDWLDGLPGPASDPELHIMKERHRTELKEELQAALDTLTARERMVLRLHLVERLGIDAIASACAVHRATVARWIGRAKEILATRVRDRLLARWQVDEGSLPAFAALLDSQLDLSLERLLAARDDSR
jgi:RNA polymerase sigma-70 factor, ECF subfamily